MVAHRPFSQNVVSNISFVVTLYFIIVLTMIKYKVYILPYILSLSIHEANKMHLTGATLLRNIGAHFRRALKFGPSCAEAH